MAYYAVKGYLERALEADNKYIQCPVFCRCHGIERVGIYENEIDYLWTYGFTCDWFERCYSGC